MNSRAASLVQRAMAKGDADPITSSVSPDLDAVAKFVRDMIARGAIAELIAAVLALLTRMRDLNTELAARIASGRRKRPPSETMRRLQLELPGVFAPSANDTAPKVEKKKKVKRGPKQRHSHGRPKLPAHLERVPEVVLVPEDKRACPSCGERAVTLDYKRAEKLDLRPAEFIVRVIEREVCVCKRCHGYAYTAPKQDEVLDRGILGNELLVQSIVDHYDDAVPWERIARSARVLGVPLSANTLAGTAGRVIDLLDPIAAHIREACFASSLTALDATSMPILDPDAPLGIRTATLWLIEGDHRYAHFHYAPTGHDDHLEALLAGRTLRTVMCDGSPTNNCVERAGGARGGCNAHARRKLVEALRLGDTRALRGVDLYAAIFHVDAESKRAIETLAQRHERRQRESAPLVEELRQWVEEKVREVEPKSPLGGALGYMRRQWKRLARFLEDPLLDLTNNEVERDLRRWVLDRKTWLFVGHETSARRLASVLSILATCRKMGIEPRRYLRETLAKLLAGEKKLAVLLPEAHEAMLARERAAAEAEAREADAA
jgi:transposase